MIGFIGSPFGVGLETKDGRQGVGLETGDGRQGEDLRRETKGGNGRRETRDRRQETLRLTSNVFRPLLV